MSSLFLQQRKNSNTHYDHHYFWEFAMFFVALFLFFFLLLFIKRRNLNLKSKLQERSCQAQFLSGMLPHIAPAGLKQQYDCLVLQFSIPHAVLGHTDLLSIWLPSLHVDTGLKAVNIQLAHLVKRAGKRLHTKYSKNDASFTQVLEDAEHIMAFSWTLAP